jgi:hypothetical protein
MVTSRKSSAFASAPGAGAQTVRRAARRALYSLLLAGMLLLASAPAVFAENQWCFVC